MASEIIAPNADSDPNSLISTFDAQVSADDHVGLQCLRRAQDQANRWSSILEVLRESDGHVEGRKGSLPQWAREVSLLETGGGSRRRYRRCTWSAISQEV